MAKIFITGISSLFVRKLVACLNGNEIIGLSRNPVNIEGVNTVVGDILEPDSWQKHIIGCDIIIHAAGLTHSFDSDKYFDVNFDATKKIVNLALKSKIKKFIYISSRTACLNSGAYGLSKLKAEEYIKANFVKYLIIKPAEIFGGSKNEGIDNIIQNAKVKHLMACPIVKNSPLMPIYVEDAVSIILKSIQNDIQGSIIINGPEKYTIEKIIKEVNLVFKHKTLIILIPKWVMLMAKMFFRITKLNLGFVPDQVDRLYCEKDSETITFPFLSLKDYLKNIKKNL